MQSDILQYECSTCGETGPKERLVEHFFRMHVPDKGVPWLCTLCGYKAVSHEQITKHTHYRRHRKAKNRWPKREVEYQKSAHPYEVKLGTDIKEYQQDKPNYYPMQTYEYYHRSVRSIVKPSPEACLNEKSSDSYKAIKRSKSRSDRSEEEPKNKKSKSISEAENDDGGDDVSSQRNRRREENENREGQDSKDSKNKKSKSISRAPSETAIYASTSNATEKSRCEKSSGDKKHSHLHIIKEKKRTPPETATSEEDSKNKKSKSISRAPSETAINASTSNATEEFLKKQPSVGNVYTTNTSISHKKKEKKGGELSTDDDEVIFNPEELADLNEEEFDLMLFLNPVKNISKALIAIETHLRKLVPVAERLMARGTRNQSSKNINRK